MRFKVRLSDQEATIEVTQQRDRLLIRYNGRSAEARLIHVDGPHFVLEVEEPGPDGFIRRRRIRAAGYRDGRQRQLWANGQLVSYELVPEGGAAQAKASLASLSASIPAMVSEILVEVGDEVTAGERLILLESMKMILPIQAPYDGRITAVNCATGEAVQPGSPLIEVSPRSKEFLETRDETRAA